VVLFLHRPDDRTYTEAIVAKHRNGPVGSVPLGFRQDVTLFESWTRVGQPS
jgi:replicative DNA helicase